MKLPEQVVGRVWLPALLLVSLAVGPTSTAGSTAPAPYELAFQVVYGDDSLGTESLREGVERWVFREVASRRCYASMETYAVPAEQAGETSTDASAGADLLFRITLTNLDVHESWDVTLAERTSPDGSGEDMSNRITATVAFDVEMEMLLLPEEARIRRVDFRHNQSYRPTMGEDPREAVRLLVLADLARSARGFACKGTKKLPREIERVRARAAD